jgi:hypothetical protein
VRALVAALAALALAGQASAGTVTRTLHVGQRAKVGSVVVHCTLHRYATVGVTIYLRVGLHAFVGYYPRTYNVRCVR